MADLSKITLPSGSSYNLKDAAARADIETLKTQITGGLHYLGFSDVELSDGSTTNPITIGGISITASSGDIAIYGQMEFIFSSTDSKWHEFGSTGSLKALAFKDSASGTTTPSGSISQPTFDGTSTTISVSGTATGNVTIAEEESGTANYIPKGSVTAPTITVTPSTVTKYVATSESAGGSKTDGTAAQCTLPVFSTSVSNETLTLGWTAGSFTANTPTAVTLPTFASQTIATGISSATSTQPTFNGTGAVLSASFTGTASTSTGTYKPSGTVSQPTFTGSEATVTVS